ncbi:MAG TPA: hypothetical protein ENK50_00510 [Sedimenticola sp.]|nr:hypothetical protein [Sedimenticola sp.]
MDIDPYAPPRSDPGAPTGSIPAPLWNPDAAGIWSLLLTPVFGSLLILRNWQALGEEARTRQARGWLYASLLMLVPDLLIPFSSILYIIVWYYAWQRLQTRYIQERWGKDYPKKSWWKPVLIGFGIIIPLNLAVISLMNPL